MQVAAVGVTGEKGGVVSFGGERGGARLHCYLWELPDWEGCIEVAKLDSAKSGCVLTKSGRPLKYQIRLNHRVA